MIDVIIFLAITLAIILAMVMMLSLGKVRESLRTMHRFQECLGIISVYNRNGVEPSWKANLDMMSYIAGVEKNLQTSSRPLTLSD